MYESRTFAHAFLYCRAETCFLHVARENAHDTADEHEMKQ